jgi:hypothetical protein
MTKQIQIFGECRKNTVQAAHVYSQRGLFLKFLSSVDFFQYFFL